MRKFHLVLVVAAAAVPAFAIHASAQTPPAKPPAKVTTTTTKTAPALSLKVPNLDAPELRFAELKATRPLTLTEKQQAVQKSGGSAQPSDFEAPFTLSPKTPWLPSGASLFFSLPWIVHPKFDVAYIGTYRVDGSLPFVSVSFTAQPSRRYLVDCSVIMNPSWRMSMRARDENGGTTEASALVAPSPAPQNHVSLLVPAATRTREITVYMSVETGEIRFWGLKSCEVTPIR